jgi:hypothetical protein
MAAAGQPRLHRGEPVLPAGNVRVGGPAVLGEVQQAAGPQYPADLGERAPRIGDRAQRPGDQRVIDAGIGHRQLGPVGPGELDRHRAGCETAGRQPLPGLRRVHRQYPGDGGRVVRHIQARAEPTSKTSPASPAAARSRIRRRSARFSIASVTRGSTCSR